MLDGRARALFSSEPLVPVPARSPWGWAMDALRFIARPTPVFTRHAWSAALVAALVTIFALDLAVDWLAILLIEEADSTLGFLPTPVEGEGSLAQEAFFALLVAPLLEEAVYRGWMSGRVAALRFALFGFAAEICFFASLWARPQWEPILAGAGVVIALLGFILWLQTRERDVAVPAWFTRHFAALVWVSTVVFALIHLGNYEALTHPLGVLVVTPQLIGGLFLAYVRTRLGLRAAMAHHAAYNALAMALEEWG